MNTKPISSATHCLIDYALVGGLLVLPTLLGFSKKVKKLYAAEAAVLGVYVAFTNHPAAVKPLIPVALHGKIDPFNIAAFTAQTFFKPFQNDKRATIFNIAFTAIAAATVLLTDWEEVPKAETALPINT